MEPPTLPLEAFGRRIFFDIHQTTLLTDADLCQKLFEVTEAEEVELNGAA